MITHDIVKMGYSTIPKTRKLTLLHQEERELKFCITDLKGSGLRKLHDFLLKILNINSLFED